MFKNTGRIYFKVIIMFFAQVGKIKEYFLFLFVYGYLNCEQYTCITFVIWKFFNGFITISFSYSHFFSTTQILFIQCDLTGDHF